MLNILKKRINFTLSKQDTSFLKGVAITFIILHNFSHWIVPVQENEYYFNLSNSFDWLNNFINGGPRLIFCVFSFWGHHGVSVFLFLSGYGLVKKYEKQSSRELRFVPFMKKNYLKLWKLLLLALIINSLLTQNLNFPWSLILLTFITNLIPDADTIYGPWWFFSLIMQYYLLYSLCFYKKSKLIPYVVIISSLFLLIISIYLNMSIDVFKYIRLNIMGWGMPFALGVIMARENFSFTFRMCLISFLLFIFSEFNAYLWAFSAIFLCIAISPLIKIQNQYIRKAFLFMGNLSAAIFVLHPITRFISLNLVNYLKFSGNIYFIFAVYIITTLVCAIIYNKILNKLPLFNM